MRKLLRMHVTEEIDVSNANLEEMASDSNLRLLTPPTKSHPISHEDFVAPGTSHYETIGISYDMLSAYFSDKRMHVLPGKDRGDRMYEITIMEKDPTKLAEAIGKYPAKTYTAIHIPKSLKALENGEIRESVTIKYAYEDLLNGNSSSQEPEETTPRLLQPDGSTTILEGPTIEG